MPCLKIVACIIPEKTVTQMYPEKTEMWINKRKNKSKEPDPQSHYAKNSLSICISNFKMIASVVPEKTVTDTQKKKKNITDLLNYGQTKSSIASGNIKRQAIYSFTIYLNSMTLTFTFEFLVHFFATSPLTLMETVVSGHKYVITV